MTKLSANKSVTRETAVLYRGKPLVITAHPKYLEVRLKGHREAVTVPYDTIYEQGIKIAARSMPAIQLRRP